MYSTVRHQLAVQYMFYCLEQKRKTGYMNKKASPPENKELQYTVQGKTQRKVSTVLELLHLLR